MCGVAEASLASSIIGGVVSAYGQVQAGKQAKAEGEYRAAIQRNNSIRAKYLADDARDRGKEAKRKVALRGRLIVGQMKTALAGNGVELDPEDSSGDLIVDQAQVNSLDVFTTENNAEREAQTYLIQADNFENEASLSEMAGRNAYNSSKFSAGGTLLSTAGSVAAKWYELDNEGAFS